MPNKLSKKKFLELLEEQADSCETTTEACHRIGISRTYYYKLRGKYQDDIVSRSKELAKRISLAQIGNLRRNAAHGDTRAAQLLLEMGGTYTPKAEINNNVKSTGTVTLPAKKPIGTPTEAKTVNKDSEQTPSVLSYNTLRANNN